MPGKVEILNIKINNVDMLKAGKMIEDHIKMNSKNSFMVVTPNAEIVVRAQNDQELARILNNADLAIPDGAGIVIASRILSGVSFSERVAGFDLMKNLFSIAVKKKYSIFLLGGKPGIASKACKNITKEYQGINICGFHHGYLNQKQQKKVIKKINKEKPDILFVGMGVPLQEKFLDKYIDILDIKVGMTVGGSFDILAGKAKRAPLWMQKACLEWLYRLFKEPSRIGRTLALPRFVYLVIVEFLKDG